MAAGVLGLPALGLDHHRRWPGRRGGGWRSMRVSMTTLEPCASTFSAADLPHHPGPVLGVLELLDEGGDVLLVPLRAGGRS